MRPDVVNWLDQFMPRGIALAIAPSWFMCVGLSGLVMLVWMVIAARRRSLDTGVIANAVLWSYLAAVVAGIVVPMAIDAVTRLVTTGQFRLKWAGMTSFWGYLAGFIAVAIVCRKNNLPIARFGDIAAAPLGLSLAFARLGCYLGGCDYGKVTSVPWAVRFPSGSSAWKDQVRAGLLPADRMESLPVHPTQLYEALLGIVSVFVALWIARRTWAREGSGRVFLAFAATYAIGRIAIETLRGDLGRGIYFGLSSGQIFSLCVLVAIAGGLLFARRRAMVAVAAVSSVLVIFIGDLHPAHAQPAPMQPQPMQPQPTVTASASGADEGPSSHLQLGALVGFATPINRRADQVPALAGGSLSVGWAGSNIGVWLDLDSYGNTDASHGTLLVSGSFGGQINPKLTIGGRIGAGLTLVNFDEPAFQDVGGTTLRFEGTIEYAIARSWMLWLRPLSIDILNAPDLGGPITTYQMRLGVAVRFGLGGTRRSRPAQSPPPAYVPAGQMPFYTPGGAPYHPVQPYYPPPPQGQPPNPQGQQQPYYPPAQQGQQQPYYPPPPQGQAPHPQGQQQPYYPQGQPYPPPQPPPPSAASPPAPEPPAAPPTPAPKPKAKAKATPKPPEVPQ